MKAFELKWFGYSSQILHEQPFLLKFLLQFFLELVYVFICSDFRSHSFSFLLARFYLILIICLSGNL